MTARVVDNIEVVSLTTRLPDKRVRREPCLDRDGCSVLTRFRRPKRGVHEFREPVDLVNDILRVDRVGISYAHLMLAEGIQPVTLTVKVNVSIIPAFGEKRAYVYNS